MLNNILVAFVFGLTLAASSLAANNDTYNNGTYTPIKQPGFCAWYGECGKSADPLIPGNLNCPYNGPAFPLTEGQFKDQLVEFCGAEWLTTEAVCCDSAQLVSLISSAEVARQLIGNCPACWTNLKTFFCNMACSPDGSTFLNVTEVIKDPSGETNNDVVWQVQYYVNEIFGTKFYDSCAEVTFSMSNTPAMLLLGGGAENYQEFFEFLGSRQFQGSPFEILFPPWPTIDLQVYTPMNATAYNCYDAAYKCSCVDCLKSCQPLPLPESSSEPCYVGSIRCLPFSLIIIFSVMFIIILIAVIVQKKRQGTKDEYTTIQDVASDENYLEAPNAEWKVYATLQRMYYRLGYNVARHPCAVILISILFIEFCALGLMNFGIVTDPVELWSDPESTTRLQKNFFDTTFGPFFRTEQFIISSANLSQNAIQEEIFALLFDIEANISALTIEFDKEIYDLKFFCFKPLEPLDDVCAYYSVTGWWQYNKTYFENPDTYDPRGWEEHFRLCTGNPSFPGATDALPCLPPFQEPIKPELVLGGYEGTDYGNASALVVTYVINNSLDERYIDIATAWEEKFVEYMKNVSAQYSNQLRITFYTESSIELELARESTADLVTVAISYLVMLLYVSFALGKFSSWRRLFVDTKFSLGILGVFICICSIVVALGILSAFGVKISLIIAEVIPFLVLAVGVDNIFILVNEFDRLDKSLPVEERAALALSEVGPSITLSAFSETVAFSLGGVVSMPAVNSFAGFSAIAIFVDFLLQITCFLTLMAADARRAESKRIDCIPCAKLNVEDPPKDLTERDGMIKWFVRHYYAPFLFTPFVKVIVLIMFALMFIAAVSFIPYVELGLDQTIALPQDSFLIPYFSDQVNLLKVGVPVYFVITGGNATTKEGKVQLCATYTACDDYSVGNILVLESLRPEYSTIALRPALWLDDYLNWANPSNRKCCRVERANEEVFCQSEEDSLTCKKCYTKQEYASFDLGPEGTEFIQKAEFWVQAIPSSKCVRAGKSAYGTALSFDLQNTNINASHFRTYHTVIQTQAEYINAYEQALRICESIEGEWPDLQCFPYTIFYVYFEQYLTIVGITVLVLAMAAFAVFLVTWLVLGSFVAAVWVVVVVLLIVINLAGVMAIWRISLNAISLVNMVMALGISVEFCSHIVRCFTITQGNRNDRARKSLIEVGPSVFNGITLTKFAGVVVLAFAQSQIFVVYYFRMYLSIVLLGFAHGLILLPVLLSFFGPKAMLTASTDKLVIDSPDKEFRQIEQRKSIYGST